MSPQIFNTLARAWRHVGFRWRRQKLDRELAEEIEFHRLQVQAENLRSGMAPEAAIGASRRQMGNITAAAEDCRGLWSFLRLERLLQDIRYASRLFRRTPGFTAVAVLSLALGIGGNAAMFSLVNALLIRPLPYHDPDRLFRITGIYPRAALPFFQERMRSMEVAAVTTEAELNLTGRGGPICIFASETTANFLSVLQTPIALGRGFAPGENSPGRDGVAILSHALWQSKFAGDPNVLGRMIAINGTKREIVGIMPPGFSYPSSRVQVWTPMRLDPSDFLGSGAAALWRSWAG